MSSHSMNIVLLGTGTSTGVPMPGCTCEVCRSSDSRDRRTRCSALISWRDYRILIDTATDLYHQALREGLGQVNAVLYTHAHADHLHGIDDLRTFNMVSKKSIPIFGSPETIEHIRANFSYIFQTEQNAGFRPRLDPWEVRGPFSLFGLPIEPIPLQHGAGTSCGYRIGPFAYLTDCNGVPEASQARLQGVKILVLDGLRFRSHPTHFTIDEAIELARRIGAQRTLLTHICHEVSHARDSHRLPDGIEFAYDGQSLGLPIGLTADAGMTPGLKPQPAQGNNHRITS